MRSALLRRKFSSDSSVLGGGASEVGQFFGPELGIPQTFPFAMQRIELLALLSEPASLPIETVTFYSRECPEDPHRKADDYNEDDLLRGDSKP